MHIRGGQKEITQGNPLGNLWKSCGIKNIGAKGVSTRFLLANCYHRCEQNRPHMRGMPVFHSVDTRASTGAADYPDHLAVCSLGSQHGRSFAERVVLYISSSPSTNS